MATARRTRQDQSEHKSDKNPKGKIHHCNEWEGVLCGVLLILGMFALVACLASLESASSGSNGLQYFLLS